MSKLNLKKLLKMLKLNESTISMVLGALVIIVIGVLAINYFKKNQTGETIPAVGTEDQTTVLPTTHEVAEGEDLWKIAEQYYGDGYKWVNISRANNLDNPNSIEQGQKILIPALETPTEIAGGQEAISQAATPTPAEVMSEPTETPEQTITVSTTNNMEPISGDSYTVVHGDNLWNIAVRAYGDGFKWVEIAKANNLVNPSLIHSGNVFVIPR